MSTRTLVTIEVIIFWVLIIVACFGMLEKKDKNSIAWRLFEAIVVSIAAVTTLGLFIVWTSLP